MILLVWAWFSIRFLFFSYWEILFLPPILVLLDGFYNTTTIRREKQLGDSNPEALGRHTQEDSKFQEQRKHSASLDKLIQKMIEDEKKRILMRKAANLKEVTDSKQRSK
ncbi:hypothetical protein TNCT_640041 [Trichonephila clavata]|uniref:Uncharacterized protein n=1 Tax=Trichonephila clavata TaxID=2740835 RepID=A0A8X6JL83_TRICU|nr:hypothetical protein TNCT_640041 [Trichonephila clavata]